MTSGEKTKWIIAVGMALFAGSFAPAFGETVIADDFESFDLGTNTISSYLNTAGDHVVMATNAPGTSGSNAVVLVSDASSINKSLSVAVSSNAALTVEFDYQFHHTGSSFDVQISGGGVLGVQYRLDNGWNLSGAYKNAAKCAPLDTHRLPPEKVSLLSNTTMSRRRLPVSDPDRFVSSLPIGTLPVPEVSIAAPTGTSYALQFH